MGDHQMITPPAHGDDTEGAKRVFEQFFILYQPALTRVEHYLEHVIDQMEPAYAEAYRPWHKALRDLSQCFYLAARKIPLPDPESFMDALRMFSFDSAVEFLKDLCISCQLVLDKDWAQHFREHIDMLLFSLTILNRKQQNSLTH